MQNKAQQMAEEPAMRRRKPAERQAALSMRIAPATRDEIVRKARQHGRSTTQEADRLLQQGLLLEKLTGSTAAARAFFAFNANGENRARELAIEGDWTLDPDCYKSAAFGVFWDILELSPPPWDGEYWHTMFENVLLNVQRIRTRIGPQSEFIADEQGPTDEEGSKP
jgi:hypothetical protein